MTSQEDQSQRKRVLVCGSTGYVGGRLVPRLLDRGYEVICLVRSPQKLEVHAWHGHPNLTVVQGELDPDDQVTIDRLGEAAINTDAAYYLIHSMISAGEDYASRDRKLAKAFADAMQQAACKRIIYLGGLGEWGPDLSRHLQSRREVAEILQQGTVPVTVFRAAMIIGSGSASFEILRYLVDRLPIMITPKWVRIETQPIAIRDVLRYLVETLDVPETVGRIIDIGGTDVLSYRDMMQMAAKAQGLSRRIILPVPVLTPKLSSGWISLVTPVSADIARPLAEGLRNRTVCKNDLATRLMPGTLFSVQRLESYTTERLKLAGLPRERCLVIQSGRAVPSLMIVVNASWTLRRRTCLPQCVRSVATMGTGVPTGCGGCEGSWIKSLAVLGYDEADGIQMS
jgi:uncharacterized protein YbjT (DUF2867 family)